MHNILQKLTKIFKTVGADELHNTQIINKWKPMNEMDRVQKTRNGRASNPDKDRKSSFILTQTESLRKQTQIWAKLGPETKLW